MPQLATQGAAAVADAVDSSSAAGADAMQVDTQQQPQQQQEAEAAQGLPSSVQKRHGAAAQHCSSSGNSGNREQGKLPQQQQQAVEPGSAEGRRVRRPAKRFDL
jgi:hypothetical protein